MNSAAYFSQVVVCLLMFCKVCSFLDFCYQNKYTCQCLCTENGISVLVVSCVTLVKFFANKCPNSSHSEKGEIKLLPVFIFVSVMASVLNNSKIIIVYYSIIYLF